MTDWEKGLVVLRVGEETVELNIDETRPRGRRFQAVSRQKLYRTYQFDENVSNSRV